MRVLFLTLYPDAAASPRYRVTQFLPYLRSLGWRCDVCPPLSEALWRKHSGPHRQGRAFWYHLHETPRRIAQMVSARRYDVVFVQKALMSAYLRGMPALLERCAPGYVYDIDDAVHLAPPHPLRGAWKRFEDRAQIQRLMAGARLVLAGNAWLAETAQAAGARAEWFPTVVDTDRFRPPARVPETYRIGWIGSPSTTPSLKAVSGALIGVQCAEVRLVGADPAAAPELGGFAAPWRLDKEVEEVQEFSIGILPQSKDEWTRGKCALKALLYMACGVPCVATPFGAAQDIIEHGRNGLFADTPDEWRSAFESLRDPGYRARLGEAARSTIETRFSLRKAAPRLAALLESVR